MHKQYRKDTNITHTQGKAPLLSTKQATKGQPVEMETGRIFRFSLSPRRRAIPVTCTHLIHASGTKGMPHTRPRNWPGWGGNT